MSGSRVKSYVSTWQVDTFLLQNGTSIKTFLNVLYCFPEGNSMPKKLAIRMARTTVFLDEVLMQYLKGFSKMENRGQGEIIRDAVRAYIKEKGFNPDIPPKIKITMTHG